jgi:photosystem II stability/assembly factor-like uncharacterized protein
MPASRPLRAPSSPPRPVVSRLFRRVARVVLGLACLTVSTQSAVAAAGARAAAPPTTGAPAAAFDPALLAGMRARSIGPAAMSGRVAAITGAPGTGILYVGAASGGIWKSTDVGLTWTPIFDDQPVASIGALAVAPSNPDVLWVGTGETNVRNSVSVGNGVYRSSDAGRTFTHLGLAWSERIHRIAVHPTDPDTAWVAAMGPLWGEPAETAERGIYKTTDGGRSWRRVLAVDRFTGANDVVVDPENPKRLLAATWEARRWPWFFRSGGPGSGLWQSDDGGESWRRLGKLDGLPEGELGRIGLAMAPSAPAVVYAIVEAADNVLLRSSDGGRSFTVVNDEVETAPRPFYFNELVVDPADPERVISLEYTARDSRDGGESFTTMIDWEEIHGDHHALWIDPADPRLMVNGNDGGVAISHDGGGSWRFVENLPLAQYYHVRLDDERPYNTYGGLQDNGSWRGPNTVWEGSVFGGLGGIRNHHWQTVAFGDGFDTAPDPANPRAGYAMSQGGWLVRYDLDRAEQRIIRPQPPVGADGKPVELRFNWNAGLAQDPFAAGTIYYGSQFVHRSRDRGESWEIISPDLTTNDPRRQRQQESGGLTLDVTAAENYTTIVALAPSPREEGTLWVGTDDGRLHVTRDGGASWTSVEKNLGRVAPAGAWIPHIHPSAHDPGTAFVVFDDHRRGDQRPYLARTRDFGASWQSLATPNLRGWALSILEDSVDPNLLFLGTELGLWWSTDGGTSWHPWRHGVPTVAVADLALHPREHDLVIATHGRGLFVIDDISPLRGFGRALLAKPLHLFAPPPAQQHAGLDPAGPFAPGNTDFVGESEPYGALLTFSLADEALPLPDERLERERLAALGAERAAERRRALLAEPERGEGDQEQDDETKNEAGGSAPGAATAPAGDDEAAGAHPPPRVLVEVRDAAGVLVRSFRAPVHRGVNRITWDLHRRAFDHPEQAIAEVEGGEEETAEGEEPAGDEVVPGSYEVTVIYGADPEAEPAASSTGAAAGGATTASGGAGEPVTRAPVHRASARVEVLADPRHVLSAGDQAALAAAKERLGRAQEQVAAVVRRIVALRQDLAAVEARLGAEDAAARRREGASARAPGSRELGKQIAQAREELDRLEKTLWQPPGTKGIVANTDALAQLDEVAWQLGSVRGAPTPAMLAYLGHAEAAAGELVQAAGQALDALVPPLREAAKTRGYVLFE